MAQPRKKSPSSILGVPLADIYHLIGYALRHSAEMEKYLRKRLGESQRVRRQNEARWNPDGVRQRLLARRPNLP